MEFLLCKICKITYDEEDHRPRHAPCGHELCTACIRALIKDSIFECPTCRQKNKVYVPDDLPIVFGLIDVIRAFKTMKLPSTEETKQSAKEETKQSANKETKQSATEETKQSTSGTTNDELCKVHKKAITHRCIKCNMWNCNECFNSHSDLLGCSLITSAEAMDNMKEKHMKQINLILTFFDDNTKHITTKIQEHSKEKKELWKLIEEYGRLVEKHSKEEETLCKLLEQSNLQKNQFLDSKTHLGTTNSPFGLMEKMEVLTQKKMSLRSWSVNNLGFGSQIALLKVSEEKTDVYAEMLIENEKRHGKLMQIEGKTYFHTFQKLVEVDDCVCIPFARLQKMIPSEASLVFLDMSIGDVERGRILVRLEKDLPKIRENFIKIVTGQHGVSLTGVKFESDSTDCTDDFPVVAITDLQLSKAPVIPDNRGKTNAKMWDIVANYHKGYLEDIYVILADFSLDIRILDLSDDDKGGYENMRIIGNVEDGKEILQEGYDQMGSEEVKIYGCGLVIEEF